LFQAIWLNAVLPGHARGVVSLSGQICPQCCQHDQHGSSETKQSNPVQRSANCALCSLAARLTLPPTIDLRPPGLGLVEFWNPPIPKIAVKIEPIRTCLGRAPPL